MNGTQNSRFSSSRMGLSTQGLGQGAPVVKPAQTEVFGDGYAPTAPFGAPSFSGSEHRAVPNQTPAQSELPQGEVFAKDRVEKTAAECTTSPMNAVAKAATDSGLTLSNTGALLQLDFSLPSLPTHNNPTESELQGMQLRNSYTEGGVKIKEYGPYLMGGLTSYELPDGAKVIKKDLGILDFDTNLSPAEPASVELRLPGQAPQTVLLSTKGFGMGERDLLTYQNDGVEHSLVLDYQVSSGRKTPAWT